MSSRFLRIGAFVLFMQLIAGQASATGEGWMTNVAEALKKAQTEGKDLLLDFSGSDWCHWCIQLDKEVFGVDSFKDEVSKSFVLVELDFPNDDSKISEKTKKQNHQWRQRLQVKGFPTVFLLDNQGRPYAKTGYHRGGSEAYLAHLSELQEVRVKRDQALAAADAVDGLEKARRLDEAMQAVGPELVFTGYLDTVESIIRLDADNSGGLKEKYKTSIDRIRIGSELQSIMKKFEPSQAIGAIAKLQAIENKYAPTGRLRMEIRGILAQMHLMAGEADQALAIADEFVHSETVHPEQRVQWKLLQSAAYAEQDKPDEAISVLDAILLEHADNAQIVMRCTTKKLQILLRDQRSEEAAEFLESRLAKASGKEKAVLEQLKERLAAMQLSREDEEGQVEADKASEEAP